MTEKAKAGACLTCYGTGEVVSENGVAPCGDCYGGGRSLDRGTTMEWRLRDLERAYRGQGRDSEADVLWLVHELRRSREALLRIVALSDDTTDAAQLAHEVKHTANEVLGLYDLDGAQGSAETGS
jgi:hypothetical protein